MLLEKIATEIVKETSLRIKRNINIMNLEGKIIAALDEHRVGDTHQGAIEVINTRQRLIIEESEKEAWPGAGPGINLPIYFQEDLQGVIGITGDPASVIITGELVKMTTELMLQQEFLRSQSESKQRTREIIIGKILSENIPLKDIEQGLKYLDLNLSSPFVAAVVQIDNHAITSRQLIERTEEILGNDLLIGFININRLFITLSKKHANNYIQLLNKLCEKLNSSKLNFKIAYSLPFYDWNGFYKAYLECDTALKISRQDKIILPFSQIEAKALFYQIENSIAKKFSDRVLSQLTDTDAQTIEVFFKNNLNIKETSDKLFIHRNTLIYRLKKIEEKLNYDPKNFEDAIILQIALWFFYKEE